MTCCRQRGATTAHPPVAGADIATGIGSTRRAREDVQSGQHHCHTDAAQTPNLSGGHESFGQTAHTEDYRPSGGRHAWIVNEVENGRVS